MAEYYYLIAGLPEMVRELTSRGEPLLSLYEEIDRELTEPDRGLVQLIRHRFDCDNLISRAESSPRFDRRGVFSEHDLFMRTEDSPELPHFLRLTGRRAILSAYYSELLNSREQRIRRWGAFERDLADCIARKTSEALGIPAESGVLNGRSLNPPKGERERPLNPPMGDFHEWEKRIDTFFSDPKKLESLIDTIRWEQADEIFAGGMFSTEAVLAFVIKLNTLIRWIELSPESGINKLNDLIDGMRNQCDSAMKKGVS